MRIFSHVIIYVKFDKIAVDVSCEILYIYLT